jgi:hypothetical protein
MSLQFVHAFAIQLFSAIFFYGQFKPRYFKWLLWESKGGVMAQKILSYVLLLLFREVWVALRFTY